MCTIKKSLMTLVIAIMGSVVALANFPNGTWDLDCYSGGECYGKECFVSHFTTPDPNLKFMNISVPYGYYEYGGEGGDFEFYVFSKPKIEGNIATFTATSYELVYEEGFGEKLKLKNQSPQVWKAVYNPLDNNVTVGESVFKDPDRQRWVVSDVAHNVNIRKTPLKGVVIGKAPKGKTFKLLGKQDVKKRNQYIEYDETWYKIDLGNGDTGFVTSEYFSFADDSTCDPSMIPVDALNKEYVYDLETYAFQRAGNKVIGWLNIMDPSGHGMAGDFYYLGRINGNGIEWYKTLWGSDGYDIFKSSDFDKFERLGEPYEKRGKNSLFPDDLFYYNDVIFEDGDCFTINND